MATKAELLKDVDTRELPATRVPDEALTDLPLENVGVGDKVVIFSRNANRIAVVVEATPKRVMVAYTTEGAWKEAQKIHEMYSNPNYVDARVKAAVDMARKNFSNYYEPMTNGTSKFTLTEAEIDRAREIVAQGIDAYSEVCGEEVRERETKARDAALADGVSPTVTTKSVKREFVFGLKEAAVAS